MRKNVRELLCREGVCLYSRTQLSGPGREARPGPRKLRSGTHSDPFSTRAHREKRGDFGPNGPFSSGKSPKVREFFCRECFVKKKVSGRLRPIAFLAELE